ncbi:MAG: hypothetical protein ABIR24_01030 [Verrucomicrobiota bacterium]
MSSSSRQAVSMNIAIYKDSSAKVNLMAGLSNAGVAFTAICFQQQSLFLCGCPPSAD